MRLKNKKCKIYNDTRPVRIEFEWERNNHFGIYPVKTTYNKIEEIKQTVLLRCKNENENRKITKITVYSYELLEETIF